jgi:hypothetical protein
MSYRSLRFDAIRKRFAQFRHFRPRHSDAVALVRVFSEIVLVVFLSFGVVLQRQHLSDYGAAKQLVCRHLGDHGIGDFFLLGGAEVNAATVLRTHVVALRVQGCGVVHKEENLQNLGQIDILRVKGELHYLVMPRIATANVSVAGVQYVAIAVATFDALHPAHAGVNGVQTPKAAAAQCDGFGRCCHGR